MQDQSGYYFGKRVIVTGGAGFVGAHLTQSLLDDGATVIVIDNYRTAQEQSIAPHENLAILRQDVIDPIKIDGAIDHVFNLACPASPAHHSVDPIATWRTSVYGTDNMVQLAQSKGARFVQASTSETYGDPLETPQREDYHGNASTVGPRACYVEGKRAAESLLMDFHRVHGTAIRIARIFNTYGPGMAENDGRVVSNFIVQALRGDRLTVYGDGSQTRSFCFVSDMVRGLKLLGSTEGIDGEVINLGNPNEITIAQLATNLGSLLGQELQVEHKPLPIDDPRRRRPDIEKAQRLLDWSPQISLAEGLAGTIEDFRNRLLPSAAA